MGCGSSSAKRGSLEESQSEGNRLPDIINEESHNQGGSSNEHPCKPHQIKRVAPSQKRSIVDTSMDALQNFSGVLRTFAPEQSHILVVDDDPAGRELIVAWFKEANYKVTSCGDGDEVAKLISSMCEGLPEGEKVKDLDVVLMDLHVSSDAQDANVLDLFVYNSHCSHIPVVVAGTHNNTQQAERMIRRGAADFIFKPMSRALVIKTVRHLLQNIVETENTKSLKKLGDKLKNDYIKQNTQNNTIGGRVSESQASRVKSFVESDVLAAVPKARVWIIDSDNETVEMLVKWLGKKYETIVSRNGEEAKEYLLEMQESKKKNDQLTSPPFNSLEPGFSQQQLNTKLDTVEINLVLAAAELEGELTGMDVVEMVSHHPNTNSVPVIMMTSEDSSISDMTQSIRIGCENCVIKPLFRDVTLKKVDTILLSNAQHNLAKLYMERVRKYQNLVELGDPVEEEATEAIVQPFSP